MELASVVSEEKPVHNLRRKHVAPEAAGAQRGGKVDDDEDDIVPKQNIRLPVNINLLNQLAKLSASPTLDEVKIASLRQLLDELADTHCKSRNQVFDFDLADFTEGSEKSLRINWQGVILKVHQSLLHTPLYDFLAHNKRKGMKKDTSHEEVSSEPKRSRFVVPSMDKLELSQSGDEIARKERRAARDAAASSSSAPTVAPSSVDTPKHASASASSTAAAALSSTAVPASALREALEDSSRSVSDFSKQITDDSSASSSTASLSLNPSAPISITGANTSSGSDDVVLGSSLSKSRPAMSLPPTAKLGDVLLHGAMGAGATYQRIPTATVPTSGSSPTVEPRIASIASIASRDSDFGSATSSTVDLVKVPSIVSLAPSPAVEAATQAALTKATTPLPVANLQFDTYADTRTEAQLEKAAQKPRRVKENPFSKARMAVLPATVFSSLYVRQGEDPSGFAPNVPATVDEIPSGSTLPSWTDVVLHWGGKPKQHPSQKSAAEDETIRDAIGLPLEWILTAMNARGHLDSLLETLITRSALSVAPRDAKSAAGGLELTQFLDAMRPVHPYLKLSIDVAPVRQRFRDLIASGKNRRWTEERYQHFLQRIVSAGDSEQDLLRILEEVTADLREFQIIAETQTLSRIERLLICLLGHETASVRDVAVRQLNVLYDGHDWQSSTSLVPVIRSLQDAFVVEIEIDQTLPTDEHLILLTCTPSLLSTSSKSVISRHPIRVEGKKLIADTMQPFTRAGYYDWRIVQLREDGELVAWNAPASLHSVSSGTITGGGGGGGGGASGSPPVPTASDKGSAAPPPPPAPARRVKTQGRVIAHPPLRSEIFHEVWVELEGAQWDWSGRMVKRGDFHSLAKNIENYRVKNGITVAYLMGALDRIAGASPFCPVDRSVPAKSLGGDPGFKEVVSKAKAANVKLVIDATTRISAKGANRKYRSLVCHSLDENGNLRVIPGTDGLEFDWQDSVQLNYRKKSTWDLLVNEISEWASKGIDGVRLDSAHCWPLILRPNSAELLRLDSDGQRHWTASEILEGEVSLPRKDEAQTYGYFGTDAASREGGYANPLFVKLTREMWAKHPQFIFLAETFWKREVNAIISGLVPYTASLPLALASVNNKGLNKDGSVVDLGTKRSTRVFYDWYETERRNYPENSIVIFPSSTHYQPYPTALYGHAAWAAVDLLYFLPEVPLTYIGEQFGWRVSVDVNTGNFKGYEGERRTPLHQICGHYDHRGLLRRTHRVFTEGGMIPLFARYEFGWHDRVFAFARFTADELVLVAINFNDSESVCYIDCAPLRDIIKDETVLYRKVDLINPSNPQEYFTLNELLHEKHYIALQPWETKCMGVYQQIVSPSAERVLYEQSMERLMKNLSNSVDPTHNLIYSLVTSNLSSAQSMLKSLSILNQKLVASPERNLASMTQTILYHATRKDREQEAKTLAYLTHLRRVVSDPDLGFFFQQTLNYNVLGPIVFVTPEIGRFSTVGGIGVMVDDLTQALVSLGLEIHIISPYYNFNRKGKTDYLAAEGIKWVQNLMTNVGNDRVEVGVHTGQENGVNLHFLHNFDYFPTPYNTGSATYQLATIVLFAKAALEYCCQMRLLPAVIVTNDWFAGLVPAYARYGAFGTTFKGTTFFHLVHNLEEGYEGKIYPDGRDLGYLHQLPRDLLIDPFARDGAINASRCALLASDQWGTVSKSYRHDLMQTSPLKSLLARHPQPFAHSNGIRVGAREIQMAKIASDYKTAKALIQQKYFGLEDPNVAIFSFVGRLTLQKGVHLILQAVRELLEIFKGRIQVLVGGMANMKDSYAANCAWMMQGLRMQYPKNFWADPNEFFTDGLLINMGSDFGLMPSLFEPSGVVQQEYFCAGTPVLAFKTGGLKDTVFEYIPTDPTTTGNGFTFEAHTVGDFVYAVKRAMAVFSEPEQYKKLRKNARDSVLDTAVVAEAWTREYCRLRRRMWADPQIVQREIHTLEKSAGTASSASTPATSSPAPASPATGVPGKTSHVVPGIASTEANVTIGGATVPAAAVKSLFKNV